MPTFPIVLIIHSGMLRDKTDVICSRVRREGAHDFVPRSGARKERLDASPLGALKNFDLETRTT